MGDITVLTESDLRAAVGIDRAAFDAIEAVYPLISEGVGSMPPIMRIEVPEHNGEIDVKSAYLPGYAGIAVKLSAGFFDNPAKGLPSLGGLMILLDTETGIPRAGLFDNGYLTDLRTGLAGAVAAHHLASPEGSSVAIFGAGAQARYQLEALTMVRPIDHVVVWARRAERAEEYAESMRRQLQLDIAVCKTPAEAVADADILVTTTPATEPLVDASLLHPGLHITAVGSDAEHKQEIAADAIERSDRVVCDSLPQSRRLGELRAALADGFEEKTAVELGDVIAGRAPGRVNPGDITICDLTGTGAQDTAIASLAVDRCLDLGVGTTIAT